ncbi:MAG: alpha/beta fold hydrolase [Deltaproteobacteria bacterium]|nr:alpha/beta fold hydrolase [Deltaproteobacteria bacterium]
MNDSLNSPLSALDRPEINALIFYPRRDFSARSPEGSEDRLFPVDRETKIGGRFYWSEPSGPHLLFFHGNGEIASDYDEAATFYQQLGLSLLAMDYRGYGKSEGSPTAGTLLSDALTCFDLVYNQIREKGRPGPFLIMGRSLGSAPAIEIASRRQEKIAGLIIESGFAYSLPLLELMGIPVDGLGLQEKDGFENASKIAQVTKPTFILHAQFDEIIPLNQADILLKNSGAKRKELVVVPGAGHNDIIARCGRAYFETIARFANSLKSRGKD